MAATLRLTVITGPHKNARFCLHGRTQCLLGRAPDCFVQLTGDARDQLISRHHCEFEFDPPCVRLTDLDSCNGTFRNGQNITELEKSVADVLTNVDAGTVQINSGDIVTVGGTSLRADIVECPPPGIPPDSVWAAGETAKKDCPVEC
jgi:serine/threonine-protein kinase